MTAREQAIEAAAEGIYWGLHETWLREPEDLREDYRADAQRGLDAALPGLLNDLADRIRKEAERGDGFGYAEFNNGICAAARLVRAAAEGWGQ